MYIKFHTKRIVKLTIWSHIQKISYKNITDKHLKTTIRIIV